MSAIDKLIEGIDSKNISDVAEAFTAAIKDHVLKKIHEASEKAFDKDVAEIDGDEKSEADGEDEDEDGNKEKDEDDEKCDKEDD